jgi:hypothetical protein
LRGICWHKPGVNGFKKKAETASTGVYVPVFTGKRKIKLIISAIVSVLFPFVTVFSFYSLLNIVNYIFIGSMINFLHRNLIIIICILLFLLSSIMLIRNNLKDNIFSEIDYIFFAWIGQLTNCILLCIMIVFMIITPLFGYYIFLTVLSQLYLYGLFEDIEIPWVMNFIIFVCVTIIGFMTASIMPIIYSEKAIMSHNEKSNEKINNIKIVFINQIKILLNIFKIRNIIKKCQNGT